jgi:hypothetical protein
MIFHGAVVLFLGLLAGFPFALVVTEEMEGSEQAWRMAHLEGVLNGILVIAVAAASARLALTARQQALLAGALVLMAYGNAVASILGAAFDVRGLQPTGPPINLVVYVIFALAVLGILVGTGLVAHGARRSAQGAGTED